MFSKPQSHHKSTPTPNFTIIPNSFDVKNMPNLAAPSEFPGNLQIQFTNYKKSKNEIWVSIQGNSGLLLRW